MKSFNVICGLPRSGSTLLCNVLNQNPEIYASSTSPLPDFLATIGLQFSQNPEITGMVIRDKEKTEKKLEDSMKAFTDSWYPEDKHIFDKGRGWSVNSLLLKRLFPGSLIVVCVRDLRAVFASLEKQHMKFPIFDAAQNGAEKTIYSRADTMLSPTGLIGKNVVGVEDILRRAPSNVLVMQYEAFTQNPQLILDKIYSKAGLRYFEHDLNNIENVAEDEDGVYHYKFPHEGSGKIEERNNLEWKEILSSDLADAIYNRYPFIIAS
jgi:sulfotransferase